jgi:hypothetical protein
MRRLVVFVVVASFASGSAAFAGETIMQSASRIVQRAGEPADRPATVQNRASSVVANRPEGWVNKPTAPSAALLAQEQPALSKSGMKKRTKAMIFLGLGVGFAASAYVIDHHVVNVTPSSLGTRKD